MDTVLASADAAVSFLPPLLRVLLWALASAGVSMGIYAAVSPQQKILALKAAQKDARRALLGHEGDFDELWRLIRRDLSLSLKQIALAIVPFLLALLPLFVLLMGGLAELYAAPLVDFGPEWMQGFEFWYVSALVIASLLIKIIFKIA